MSDNRKLFEEIDEAWSETGDNDLASVIKKFQKMYDEHAHPGKNADIDTVTPSCGNVFEDLGLPDAAKKLERVRLLVMRQKQEPKLCKDCRFSELTDMIDPEWMCSHGSSTYQASHSLVTGVRPEPERLSCRWARTDYLGECGVSGRFWEPRDG